MKAHVIMRIKQLTQALNLFLLLQLLLQFIAIAATAAFIPLRELSPKRLRNRHTHQKRLSGSLDQIEDMGDVSGGSSCNTAGSGCNEAGGDLNSMKCGPNSDSFMGHPSPKQTATNIAQKAAHEAEQAYGTQQSAAAEVSHMVKKQLADRAYAAAKAAEAALSGKQQIVEQLEAEISDAESVMQQATDSIASSQNNLHAAHNSAKKAHQLFLAMEAIMKLAKENLCQAKNAATGAQQEFDDKAQLMETAQCRIDTLKKRLCESRRDLQNIKKSAYKAVCAAAEARKKASRERRTAVRRGRRKRQIQHEEAVASQ